MQKNWIGKSQGSTIFFNVEGSIEKIISKHLNDEDNISINKSENISRDTAEIIMNNHILARCSGKMEWGARALGNRSILANPKDWSNVEKINSAAQSIFQSEKS